MGAPAARVYELSKRWVEWGHEVQVLTAFPNHPTGVVPREYRRRMRRLSMREQVDGIEVVRTWLYPAPNRRPIERIVNYSSFFLSTCVRGLFLKKPDVVIGTSPQLLVGLAGWWISRLTGCPFVFEVRDLWPESLVASGIGNENSFFIDGLHRLASFLYRRCHRVVVVTQAFKDVLVRERKCPEEKIEVVENGVETEKFCPISNSYDLRRQLGLGGKFVVSYIGTIGYAHGLEVIVRAAELIQKAAPDVLFLLVGEGAEKETLRRSAESKRFKNVLFIDQQPRETIPSFLNASDVCLVLLRGAELFTTVLPSKMLEAMACARPIVLGVDGYARQILDRAQAGIYVRPEDPQGLVQAVLALYRDRTRGSKLGENGREFVSSQYSRQKTALEYLGILQRLVVTKAKRAEPRFNLDSSHEPK